MLAADDVLILANEILRTSEAAGADGVLAMLREHPLDWRAPLACAWASTTGGDELGRTLAASPALSALIAALRANLPPREAGEQLAAYAGEHLPSVLTQLVAGGDAVFAEMVAQAAQGSPAVATVEADAEAEGAGPSALAVRLRSDWETQKADLAALADALATLAESGADPVSAIEARQHALQLQPSEARVADLALTYLRGGDISQALDTIPPGDKGALADRLRDRSVSGGASRRSGFAWRREVAPTNWRPATSPPWLRAWGVVVRSGWRSKPFADRSTRHRPMSLRGLPMRRRCWRLAMPKRRWLRQHCSERSILHLRRPPRSRPIL
jgi:hypothetical protein